MVNTLKFASISLLVLLVFAFSLTQTARAEDPANNQLTASGTAPGGDRQFEINPTSGGTITIAGEGKVKVGNPPAAVPYTVLQNGTSSPTIVLDSAPAAGAAVTVEGTTSGSGGPYTTTLNWNG